MRISEAWLVRRATNEIPATKSNRKNKGVRKYWREIKHREAKKRALLTVKPSDTIVFVDATDEQYGVIATLKNIFKAENNE